MTRYLTFLLTLFSLLQLVHGFCIYNNYNDGTEATIIQETQGNSIPRQFKAYNMRPGDVRCCHYSDRDCNASGKPYVEAVFSLRVTPLGDVTTVYLMGVPAGGYIVFQGDKVHGEIISYYSDGRVYNPSPRRQR
ncbi:hypothetical protein BDF14DRAFT_1878188 [Spinellus fusiger]|nr:hypothetical protein BDF14DRAFT_1878188 [Spinellus fusiger]